MVKLQNHLTKTNCSKRNSNEFFLLKRGNLRCPRGYIVYYHTYLHVATGVISVLEMTSIYTSKSEHYILGNCCLNANPQIKTLKPRERERERDKAILSSSTEEGWRYHVQVVTSSPVYLQERPWALSLF